MIKLSQRIRSKAQSTAEYAVLFGLVIAAALAMQTYVKRSLQGKVASTTDYMTAVNGDIAGQKMGTKKQYEPYYLKAAKDVQTRQGTTTRDEEIKAKEARTTNTDQDVDIERNATEATHKVQDW